MRFTLSFNSVATSFFCTTTITPAIPVITTTLLKQCRTVIQANLVHQQILVQGLTEMATDLIGAYIACDAPGQAISMLERLAPSHSTVFWWNALIRRAVRLGFLEDVLGLYRKMQRHGWRPDHFTFPFVLKACGELPSFLRGASVHAVVCAKGFESNVFVCNAVVTMYGRCVWHDHEKQAQIHDGYEDVMVKDVVSWNAMVTGYSQIGRFEDVLALFKKMRENNIELNVVTWSAVIAGHAQRGHGYEALDVFRHMQVCGSEPNVVTLVSLLSGCAAVGALLHGKETHCYAVKCILNLEGSDPGDDLMVINSLIDMYAKCQSSKVARMMFDLISPKCRNVVTWTVMIGGYAQHGEANDALELFFEMLGQENLMKPNAFTISCVLVACSRLAALRLGKQIHAYVLRNQLESVMVFVANCLIDMYSKSGDIDAARLVFDNMKQRNAVSWTSLMTGYGMHGRGEEALLVFDEMRRAGWVPDGVTLVVVLYACSHAGMVEQGIKYFDSMSKEFGIVPGVEHYACLVDLLGRAGRLDEALKLIEDMPMEPTPIVWVALLSACRTHPNVQLGEYAASRLSELESENDGSYTLLSNIYASARRWKDVARVRSMMKHTGVKKRPGCSWVQGKKGTATFFVGDWSHPLSRQMHVILEDLIQRIKAMGYVPETSFALHDVDDEEKGDLLFEHSEKLALAYGILTTPAGAPIHITKNLRVCGDCHAAMTYISKIIDHEIILRDSSRFHHFRKGSCSCGGYW
ncbi:hypothetical protein CJ030_MR1G008832 [Morella rubra]|uniref:DYW domain-containing protein n=1 Tax=Morella rubra TaxID=262757 RepID=A0A6A1WIC5_9ROSI|nr:hypothetical protein CJ030_MR1G008832 [Morella rubra]